MISSVSIAMSDLIGPLLGRVHERLRAEVEASLAAHELHVRQFGALVVLATEGPMSQRRLGTVQGVDRTTTVAVLDALQERGLVERRRDPDDRRVHVVHLTTRGSKLLGRAQGDVLGAEQRFLATLGPEGEDLRRLLRALLDQPPAPSTGRRQEHR